VRSVVLPVSFARAPRAFDRALRGEAEAALLLGLGVAKRRGFRLERWAGPQLKLVQRPDVDGRLAQEYSASGARLEAGVALTPLLAALRARGLDDVRISHSAGGYVCERIYHHLLLRARARRVPGLFLHVPPLRFTALERQQEVVGWVIQACLELQRAGSVGLKRRGRSSGSRPGSAGSPRRTRARRP
jgi:pyrrolidone-carboxylate peptidase